MRVDITYQREVLYKQVWTKPVRVLAKEYGVSDVSLAKVCRRLSVPRPDRGYWLRIAAGGEPSWKPLPKLRPGQPAEYRSNYWLTKPAPIVYPADLAQLPTLEEVAAPVVSMAPDLANPHPTLREAVVALGQERPRPATSAAIENDVRVLRIYDGLFKALEAAGHAIHKAADRRFPVVIVDGHELWVRLNEIQPRRTAALPEEHPAPEATVPVPLLRFSVGGHRDSEIPDLHERPSRRFDERVGDLFAKVMLAAADAKRRAARDAELERRTREEEDRKRRRAEELNRDKRDLERLTQQAAQWEEAQRVKRYLAAVRAEASVRLGDFGSESQAAEWFARMERLAAQLDPIPDLFVPKAPAAR